MAWNRAELLESGRNEKERAGELGWIDSAALIASAAQSQLFCPTMFFHQQVEAQSLFLDRLVETAFLFFVGTRIKLRP
jgi:hypothetical protein